jgi:hypothetical protein
MNARMAKWLSNYECPLNKRQKGAVGQKVLRLVQVASMPRAHEGYHRGFPVRTFSTFGAGLHPIFDGNINPLRFD